MKLKSINPSKNVEQLKAFGYIHRIFETFCACYLPAHTITIKPILCQCGSFTIQTPHYTSLLTHGTFHVIMAAHQNFFFNKNEVRINYLFGLRTRKICNSKIILSMQFISTVCVMRRNKWIAPRWGFQVMANQRFGMVVLNKVWKRRSLHDTHLL